MSAVTVTTRTANAPVVKFDPKPKASLVDVTPAQAAKWLELNTHNRRLRQRLVDAYARDMSGGNWQVTGEAIRFGTDGSLLDGQHRLAAIVQSGSTVTMFVIRGLSTDTQTVMDSGAKRTSGDALRLRGHSNTSLLAATTRLALTVAVHGYSAAGKATFTTTEIAEFVTEHPELEHYVAEGQYAAKHIDASPTAVSYAMWRLFSLDAEAASDFFDKAVSRVGIEAGDPVLTMTKRFAEARRHRETLSMEATLGIIFRAWNARRAGKTLQRIPVASRSGDVVVPEPV